MQLVFEQVRLGGDRNFGYLIGDREAAVGAVVDPAYAPELLVERAEAQGLTVTHVLNTHGHPDHIEGNPKAVELTGALVAAHPDSPAEPDVPLIGGDTLALGALELTFLYTPGHADDHLVIWEPTNRILLTGDLIFVGKVGGTKTEEAARVEWESLRRVLGLIPDDATVWPGHDYGCRPSSTIALEKATNPFLRCDDVDEFLELRSTWADYKKEMGLL